MFSVRVFSIPVVAFSTLYMGAVAAQPIAPASGQEAFRARPHAAHVRACERAVVQKVRADKNGAVTQLMEDTVEEWQITAAKHGVRGDGRYLSGDHWKHFRFSCLHGDRAGVTQMEYHNVPDISSPATAPMHSPRDNGRAFKACEAAVRAKVSQDKNTGDINVAVDGADEWDVGPGVVGVRGHGFYQHNAFRFHCNYDSRQGRVTAIDYHKTSEFLAPIRQPSRPPAGPTAQAAPRWQDLDGARASTGEDELQRRGFELSARRGLTAFWNHAPSQTCLRVVTDQGRYAVSQVPFVPNCPL